MNGSTPADHRAPGPSAGTSRTGPQPRTGRNLARLTLTSAVLTAAFLGVAAFETLRGVDLASVHPFATALAWLTAFGVGVALAAAVVVLALVACVRCRPRRVAVLALVAAVVLPAPSVGLAVTLGLSALRSNAVADLRADAVVVSRSLSVLESWDIDVEPLRRLVDALPVDD